MKDKILIFRTSIEKEEDVQRVVKVLNKCSQIKGWSIDFEDWEKVLRIECKDVDALEITTMLRRINVQITELE